MSDTKSFDVARGPLEYDRCGLEGYAATAGLVDRRFWRSCERLARRR
jgi:hypothetical protein